MRLNKAHKAGMVAAILATKFNKELDKLHVVKRNLVSIAVSSLYDGSTAKWVSEAPKGALPTRSDFYLAIEGTRISVNNRTEVPVRYNHQYSPCTITLNKANSKAFQECEVNITALGKQKEEFKSKLTAALASCHTSKRVRELYPDMKEYLPAGGTVLVVSAEEVKNLFKEEIPRKVPTQRVSEAKKEEIRKANKGG